MQNKIDSDQIAQKLDSQGEKIKYLRRLCGLSRKAFFDKYQISESTLRSWELNISPISNRLMDKFLEALSKEGLSISAAWIRSPSQEMPETQPMTRESFTLAEVTPVSETLSCEASPLSATSYTFPEPSTSASSPTGLNLQEKTVEDEARFFLESKTGRLISRVQNAYNEPFFHEGDLVGGEVCPFDREDLIYHNFCLAQLPGSLEWRLCLVKPSVQKTCFTLLYAKSHENPVACRILYDVKLSQVAPIIWHRRLSLKKISLKKAV